MITRCGVRMSGISFGALRLPVRATVKRGFGSLARYRDYGGLCMKACRTLLLPLLATISACTEDVSDKVDIQAEENLKFEAYCAANDCTQFPVGYYSIKLNEFWYYVPINCWSESRERQTQIMLPAGGVRQYLDGGVIRVVFENLDGMWHMRPDTCAKWTDETVGWDTSAIDLQLAALRITSAVSRSHVTYDRNDNDSVAISSAQHAELQHDYYLNEGGWLVTSTPAFFDRRVGIAVGSMNTSIATLDNASSNAPQIHWINVSVRCRECDLSADIEAYVSALTEIEEVLRDTELMFEQLRVHPSER